MVVARNVLMGEVKFLLGNRVPGVGGWTLRKILWSVFGRWDVEGCFREAKEELGWDHFECRSWVSIDRHLFAVILGQLFCSRVRQKLNVGRDILDGDWLTMEQVRRAVAEELLNEDLPPIARSRRRQWQDQCDQYHRGRNAAASRSHRKRRSKDLHKRGIDAAAIKAAVPPETS